MLDFIVYPSNSIARPVDLDFDILWLYNSGMKPKKPKRGRPHKNPDEAKSKSILLRLEPREKEVFGDAATIAGIPLTDRKSVV